MLKRRWRQDWRLKARLPTKLRPFLTLLKASSPVREVLEKKGISIGDNEYRISLFADDILLNLTDLQGNAPKLMLLLRWFGSFWVNMSWILSILSKLKIQLKPEVYVHCTKICIIVFSFSHMKETKPSLFFEQ